MTKKKPVRVQDVMTTGFLLVDGLDSVSDAIQKMRESGVAVLIVKKRDDDDEYGIVVPADIAKKVLGQDRSPGRLNVYEIMSKPVISVHSRMDVRYCARLFEHFGLSVAPVIDDSEVLGIVSYNGIVQQGFECAEE